MNSITILFALLCCFFALPVGYLLCLAFAAVYSKRLTLSPAEAPLYRFAIVIPAHNEESVIADTVRRLSLLDYPRQLFTVHIVADYCSDQTAEKAQRAGAVVHERNQGPRTGKGAALAWLFQRILNDAQEPHPYEAVIVFDADTLVDANFLRVMDARLKQGEKVIQGQHIIVNHQSGWFPALTWAMFLIDNRLQNLGRANLGWSAKNMGDSICLRADVLRQAGWGEGLTEDYQLRQKLLLMGVKIAYEPAAKGYGEAALTWAQARAQRARWLRGSYDSSRQFARHMLHAALHRRDLALLDGALQAYLPSYSSLTLIGAAFLLLQAVINQLIAPPIPQWLLGAWLALIVLLFVYPLWGLLLEKAPLRAYWAILSGPLFILWRTWLAVKARFVSGEVKWVRTQHGVGRV